MKTKEFKPLDKHVYLSSPTMHGEELKYMKEAYDTNWMSTVGENINEVERLSAEKTEMKYAVALASGTAALHLCCRLAGERLYGKPETGHGTLEGKRVFCSDMTFAATVNPVVYENGIPVFIDTEVSSWNMDPVALEKAFELYPEVKLVVCAELYGFPGRIDTIRDICHKHNALLIEDAAEALGAMVNGKPCGSFGDYSAISFNGNKIITGSSGGCLLTNNKEEADKARKWSTQSRENAPWYQHVDLGYNYRMSNVVAGVIRGQFPYLDEHISQKKAIYERYKEGLKDLPVKINPITEGTIPNYWLSSLIIEPEYMCEQIRGDLEVSYIKEQGKTCPTEILEAITGVNAEGRPIWKPMHMQPTFRTHKFVGRNKILRCKTNVNNEEGIFDDVGADIFNRGLCLPSDNKMTIEQQDRITEAIKIYFSEMDF